MNRENLQRMADHVRTIRQECFNMCIFETKSSECGTIGCSVGHCKHMYTKHGERPTYYSSSLKFTGITPTEWVWCFSEEWEDIDNTPEGAALRIEWLINHGLPENWTNQIFGEAQLCYK